MKLGLSISIALLLGCLSLAACASGDYKQAVAQKLQQSRLSGVIVDWNPNTAVIRLTGIVTSSDDRLRAEALAAQTIGANGHVVNELKVRRPGEILGTAGNAVATSLSTGTSKTPRR